MAEVKNKDVEVVSEEDNVKKALEIHNQQKKNVEAAKNSSITSRLGKEKTVTIAENSEHPYSITMRFPGTAMASRIEDAAANQFGNIDFTELMQQAIQYVIVSPKITSLDFWDSHKGYSEVALEVLNFLNEGLN